MVRNGNTEIDREQKVWTTDFKSGVYATACVTMALLDSIILLQSK